MPGRNSRCSYPLLSLWGPRERSRGRASSSFCDSLCVSLSFPLPLSKSFLSAAISCVKLFLGAYLNLLGQAWA